MTATLTTLVSFNDADGALPEGDLIADANGDLFGTNPFDGTVFEIAKTASGYASTPTTLVSFSGADGSFPSGSLISDANGGTTIVAGGAVNPNPGSSWRSVLTRLAGQRNST